MKFRSDALATALCHFSVTRPRVVVALAAIAMAFLLSQAAKVTSEVGYAAYFGPDDPSVERLSRFLDEFDSGLHILIVLSCIDSDLCDRVGEPDALDLLAQMHREIDDLPNVRRTLSVLNSPIVVGELDTRFLANRMPDGSYQLSDDWHELLARTTTERFLVNTVISTDERTAGLVVELQSLESERVRDLVHAIFDLVPDYEATLGAEIFLAGDPIWTVMSDDDLNADSLRLTVLMFVVIVAVLFTLYRSLWMTIVPVLTVGVLTGAVHGLIGLASIPMTSILAALPPLLVAIAITTSIHLLTAWTRALVRQESGALVVAAGEVGQGCFWASVTTAGGFASFLWSDLESFRAFGLMAAVGILIGFVLTFTLLPALLSLARFRTRFLARPRRPRQLQDVLGAAYEAVARSPGFVLATGLVVLGILAAGLPQLYYHIHFGDESFVLRSVRFMEANFRKPMTTEIVVSVPEGMRIYDEPSLRLLARIEDRFRSEPSTGYVWSFLDFLEEAYRVDRGRPVASFEELVSVAAAEMPIVAGFGRVSAFWSESAIERDGSIGYRDRARVSVDRSWLDDQTQAPYVARVRSFVDDLNREVAARGFEVTLEGGLPLNELAIERIRSTQRSSFLSAFSVVAVALAVLFLRAGALAIWAGVANLLPVVALLGLMGWIGIGVDPANTMVGAILLTVAADDTIHLGLRYWRGRQEGAGVDESLRRAYSTCGEAVVVTSLCLALGFSVMMFSRWGGLVSFGLLASLGVLLALLADLLLLPAGLLFHGRHARLEGRAE